MLYFSRATGRGRGRPVDGNLERRGLGLTLDLRCTEVVLFALLGRTMTVEPSIFAI